MENVLTQFTDYLEANTDMKMEQDFEQVLTSLRTNYKSKEYEMLEKDMEALTTEIKMSKSYQMERNATINKVMISLK